jgi:hypothetical protein
MESKGQWRENRCPAGDALIGLVGLVWGTWQGLPRRCAWCGWKDIVAIPSIGATRGLGCLWKIRWCGPGACSQKSFENPTVGCRLTISVLAICAFEPDASHQIVSKASAIGTLEIQRYRETLRCTTLFKLSFDVSDVRADDFFDLRGHDRSCMRESLGDVLPASRPCNERFLIWA